MYNTPNILGGNLFKVSWLANLSKSSSICLEIERPLNSPSSWIVWFEDNKSMGFYSESIPFTGTWVLDDSNIRICLRVSLINSFQGNKFQLTWTITYFQVTVFQQAWTSSRHDIPEPYRTAISVSWVNTAFTTRDNITRSLCIFSPYEMQ